VPTYRGQWKANSAAPAEGAKPVTLIYNSLAHGADRGRIWMSVFNGGFVVFTTEERLLEDIVEYRPQRLFAFGNYWNDLYRRAMDDPSVLATLVRVRVDTIVTGGTFTLPEAKRFLADAFNLTVGHNAI
jgi:hypothetical protein